jgi:hypothetical protein
VVAGETAAPSGPGESSLDHPTARLHGEAALPGLRPDEFDADWRGARDARSGIGAISVAQRDERPGTPRGEQQRDPAVAVV